MEKEGKNEREGERKRGIARERTRQTDREKKPEKTFILVVNLVFKNLRVLISKFF